MKSNQSSDSRMIPTGEATARLKAPGAKGDKSIVVIGTEAIREGFDATCIQQAINARSSPGVTDVVLNPDGHAGYGAPIGCVMVSPTHIYPGPVGVDIKCSMSLIQFDLPEEAVADKRTRRALIEAIGERTPTGAGKGQRSVPKSRWVEARLGLQVATEGATPAVCRALGIPEHWAERCEDAGHVGRDGTRNALAARINKLIDTGNFQKFDEKIRQLGSYGSGNHFGECNIVEIAEGAREAKAAEAFGLRAGGASFLSHCGSRGFGYTLAQAQFKKMKKMFEARGIEPPAGDYHLVYAELGTPEANEYLDDMALAGNFATVNHLLINALVLEAFQEVIPGARGELVYFISHNIARLEETGEGAAWVHRKGATRALPAGHPGLAGTPFAETGHPILLPGNPQAGSVVMVADPGAALSAFSVNHGAGRCMGRKAAFRALNQKEVDASFHERDILTNCRSYPLDEAPAAYKDFGEVVRSVEAAGLASTVARLRARFVIKDQDKSYGGAA